MSLETCFQRAVAIGVISREEGDALRERHRGLIADGLDNGAARDRLAKQLALEADQRERAALMTHVAIDRLTQTMEDYTDYKGRKDIGKALIALHENMGDNGSFVQDAKGLQDTITNTAIAEMKDVVRELRRGAVSGDLRRTLNPRVKARMDNMVREIWGENTGDAKAKMMAQAWMQTAEKLRTRFNAAGGAIGKLEGGYVPQGHDRLALIDFGRTQWVDHMMEAGRLDRDRMVDQASGEKLTDSELRRALGLAWDRITTDGYYDIDITGQPKGKGALYTQHMDHRFIHFKNADTWLEYARRFGKGDDVYATMMGHISMMARDIAHMEIFGPNPNRTRGHLKQYMRSQAAKTRSNDAVIDEQIAQGRELLGRLNVPKSHYTGMLDRIAEIHKEIDLIRSKYGWMMRREETDKWRQQADQDRISALNDELAKIEIRLSAYRDDRIPRTMNDAAVLAELEHLVTDLREPIVVRSGVVGDRAVGWVNKQIARADAMWDQMRGGEIGDPVIAARMQSVRNVVSSAALGSAVLSSLTDPSFGQDMRLRMGMAMVNSNFARVAIAGLREMITMGSREDAIAMGLGLDSALRVLHRQAREVGGFDHRFWTGYVADRVLTTGLLLPWTQAGKHLFGLDAMRFFAKLSTSEFDGLPASTRRFLTANGFDAAAWNRLRLVEKKDGMWMSPTDVIAADRMLGERYLQMILRGTKHAIPEATIESSSVIPLQGKYLAGGTLMGEIARSGLQFKGFAFAVMMLHPMRIARELGAGDARGAAAGYAATLFLTSTFLGMIAIALKDMKDGRDPRKWLDEKTWLDPFYVSEAILQAGGLGIFGDFLRASENRVGGGLAGTVMGPLGGKVENVIQFGMAGARQGTGLAKPNGPTPQEEAVKLLRSGTVPFSNHLLTAVFYQKLMDQMQIMVDPDAYKAFQRKINQRQKDYGQGYWFRPGTTSPQRAPDVGRAWSTR